MLVCKKCGSREVLAVFDVSIEVTGRLINSGPGVDKLPEKFRERYTGITNVRIHCEENLRRLQAKDAREIKCANCGGKKFDDVCYCPECGEKTDDLVFCEPGSRVVCPNCASKSWCRGCGFDRCPFFKKFAKPGVRSRADKWLDDVRLSSDYHPPRPETVRPARRGGQTERISAVRIEDETLPAAPDLREGSFIEMEDDGGPY